MLLLSFTNAPELLFLSLNSIDIIIVNRKTFRQNITFPVLRVEVITVFSDPGQGCTHLLLHT